MYCHAIKMVQIIQLEPSLDLKRFFVNPHFFQFSKCILISRQFKLSIFYSCLADFCVGLLKMCFKIYCEIHC